MSGLKVAGWFLLIFVVTITLRLAGCFGEAAGVAQKEFGAEAMMKKYEWFKNTANDIKAMDATIVNLREKQDDVNTQYEKDYGKDRGTWDIIVKNQYQKDVNLGREQLNATVAQRNKLVADYNAQASKFNWSPFLKRADAPNQSFEELK